MSVLPLSGFIRPDSMLAAPTSDRHANELKEAVQAFETLLWEEMLRSAERASAQLKEDEAGGKEQYFTDMLHSQFATQMVKQTSGTEGLSAAIEKQLSLTSNDLLI